MSFKYWGGSDWGGGSGSDDSGSGSDSGSGTTTTSSGSGGSGGSGGSNASGGGSGGGGGGTGGGSGGGSGGTGGGSGGGSGGTGGGSGGTGGSGGSGGGCDADNPLTLDFEGLVSETIIAQVPAGHGGFTWDANTYFVQNDLFNAAQGAVVGVLAGTEVSGLDNSLGSGDNAIFNLFGTNTITVSRADAFDFNQAEMGAIWRDGQSVTIEGFLNGVSTGTQSLTLDTGGSQTVLMDNAVFDAVDTVVFTIDDITGTASLDPNYQSADGAQIFIDDMQFLIC